MSNAELTVLYDADCGFCTRSASLVRRLDRNHVIQLRPLQAAAQSIPDAPAEAALMELMHAQDRSGQWHIGGQAWLRIAELVPLLRPFAWVARLPLIRDLVEPVYALIARNRHRISRLFGDDACATDPARR